MNAIQLIVQKQKLAKLLRMLQTWLLVISVVLSACPYSYPLSPIVGNRHTHDKIADAMTNRWESTYELGNDKRDPQGTDVPPDTNLLRGSVDEITETNPALDRAAREGRMYAMMSDQVDFLEHMESQFLSRLFVRNLTHVKYQEDYYTKSKTEIALSKRLEDVAFRYTLLKAFNAMKEAISGKALPENKPVRLCIVVEDKDLPTIVFRDPYNNLIAHAGQGKKRDNTSIYAGYKSFNIAFSTGQIDGFKQIIAHEADDIIKGHHVDEEIPLADRLYDYVIGEAPQEDQTNYRTILNKIKGKGLAHAVECIQTIARLSDSNREDAIQTLSSFVNDPDEVTAIVNRIIKHFANDYGYSRKGKYPFCEAMISKAIALAYFGVDNDGVRKILQAGKEYYNSYDIRMRDEPQSLIDSDLLFSDKIIKLACVNALMFLGDKSDDMLQTLRLVRNIKKYTLDNELFSLNQGAKQYGMGIWRYTGQIMANFRNKAGNLPKEDLFRWMDRDAIVALGAQEGIKQEPIPVLFLGKRTVEEYIAEKMAKGEYIDLSDTSSRGMEIKREIIHGLEHACDSFLKHFGRSIHNVFSGKRVILIEMPIRKGEPIRNFFKDDTVYIFFSNRNAYVKSEDYGFCHWKRVQKPGTTKTHFDVDSDYLSQLVWYEESHTEEEHAVVSYNEIAERLAPNFIHAVGHSMGLSIDVHMDSDMIDLYSQYIFYANLREKSPETIDEILNDPQFHRNYFGPFVDPGDMRFSVSITPAAGYEKEESKVEDVMADYAKETSLEISREPKDRYTLFFYPGLFAKDEFEAEKERYKGLFIMEEMTGSNNEERLGSILKKVGDNGDKAIALVPSTFSEQALAKLLEKRIRFLRVTPDTLLNMHEKMGKSPDGIKRRNVYRRNIYGMMLAARIIDISSSSKSAVWHILKYYLDTCYDMEGDISEEGYVDAILHRDVSALVCGAIAPLQNIHLPVHKLVTETLLLNDKSIEDLMLNINATGDYIWGRENGKGLLTGLLKSLEDEDIPIIFDMDILPSEEQQKAMDAPPGKQIEIITLIKRNIQRKMNMLGRKAMCTIEVSSGEAVDKLRDRAEKYKGRAILITTEKKTEAIKSLLGDGASRYFKDVTAMQEVGDSQAYKMYMQLQAIFTYAFVKSFLTEDDLRHKDKSIRLQALSRLHEYLTGMPLDLSHLNPGMIHDRITLAIMLRILLPPILKGYNEKQRLRSA